MLKLSRKLYKDNPEAGEAFLHALQSPVENKAFIVLSDDTSMIHLNSPEGYPWHPSWIARVPEDVQAGKLLEHDEGKVYVLDMSSVFAASILQSVDLEYVDLVFDVCAAPGGKAIFAWRMFHPKLLVANEVVNKRIPGLISNIKRCHIGPSIVTARDPSFFVQSVPGSAPLVVVDAPCSGQSLIVKGDKSSGCFHNSTINMNSNRQRRIISNAAQLVCPGGYLSYMTCTFSPEENEKVITWFMKKFPEFSPVTCEKLKDFQSFLTDIPCYRLFPQQGIGAGAFTSLFKRSGDFSPAPVELYDTFNPVYRYGETRDS